MYCLHHGHRQYNSLTWPEIKESEPLGIHGTHAPCIFFNAYPRAVEGLWLLKWLSICVCLVKNVNTCYRSNEGVPTIFCIIAHFQMKRFFTIQLYIQYSKAYSDREIMFDGQFSALINL